VAPIVNLENSQEAEVASEVVLIFLPEEEGIDLTLKVGKDQTMKEIEVATKATQEVSLEVAVAGLMLHHASTTKIESNFHPEDSKGMMIEVVKFNKDPSEAVVASEVVISKTEEAVECTPEEAASEAIALKAITTEAEEAASVVIEEASVVIEEASLEIEAASVEIEAASVVIEMASVVAMMEKSSVAKEVATVVAMREMRVEEDMIVQAPLPPSLLHRPEEEANLPIIAER
jgi:hypothetical protein